ncbi:hypothetical protein EYF80_012098 [Liparis tanakae]|uniref:Uncharacterized protein n=1 Tax=Liparis tanakae TaxID=230148 RepID=A0A4Z2IIH8_9TELE|nr:hypothetical protein EYF80_012098 [Liparis tanakae]
MHSPILTGCEDLPSCRKHHHSAVRKSGRLLIEKEDPVKSWPYEAGTGPVDETALKRKSKERSEGARSEGARRACTRGSSPSYRFLLTADATADGSEEEGSSSSSGRLLRMVSWKSSSMEM